MFSVKAPPRDAKLNKALNIRIYITLKKYPHENPTDYVAQRTEPASPMGDAGVSWDTAIWPFMIFASSKTGYSNSCNLSDERDHEMKQRHSFLKRNGLLLIFLLMMFLTMIGQACTGWKENNFERQEKGMPVYSMSEYLGSGHFIQSTFENWESEFLQMGMYVFMTIFLFQQGSAESKSLDEPEEVDRKPQAHADAPWPIKKGGIYLAVYKNSLSLIFLILFALSFFLHAYGTMKNINEETGATVSFWQVFMENQFWFESFQNWQSEFLSVAAIVFFSIYLRQQGSPESKPVDAPHYQTGK